MDNVFRLKRSGEDAISQIFRLRRKKGGAGKKSDPMDIGTTFRLKKNVQIPTNSRDHEQQRVQSFLPNYEDVYNIPSMIPI